MSKNTLHVLMGIYLVLAGLAAFGLSFPFSNYITGAVAVVAGVLFFTHK
ncbi:MAG: hypothetical protein GXP40_08530 [Chloroflexi bacterium]|nr:hypothetical protein [Chloroflexota bacterium]